MIAVTHLHCHVYFFSVIPVNGVVEVTFQVCVRGHLYSQVTGSKPYTGKTGRDHDTRFGGKQCPLLRSTRMSAGLRCIFIADSAQTAVRHLESVRSPRFSRHCTVRTPFTRLQTPYGLRVFYVRAPCVCLRRPNQCNRQRASFRFFI